MTNSCISCYSVVEWNCRQEWATVQDAEDHRLWAGTGGVQDNPHVSCWHLRLDGPWGHQNLHFLKGFRCLEVSTVIFCISLSLGHLYHPAFGWPFFLPHALTAFLYAVPTTVYLSPLPPTFHSLLPHFPISILLPISIAHFEGIQHVEDKDSVWCDPVFLPHNRHAVWTAAHSRKSVYTIYRFHILYSDSIESKTSKTIHYSLILLCFIFFSFVWRPQVQTEVFSNFVLIKF